MKAFPLSSPEYPDTQGMDLRDYFAAKAMQGMGANSNDDHNPETETYEEYVAIVAKCAYEMADAMMKAREA